ncbi:MAG: DNA polymerase III subunit delta [Vicingaceae bacterium]
MQFKDIVGQEELKKRLINSVKNNRISHAQLFLGKDGYGSLPLAIAYAQFLSCKNRSENDSCSVCSSCVKFNKFVHPDLHFVFPVNTTTTVKEKPVSSLFLEQWRTALTEHPYLSLDMWQKEIALENKQLNISVQEGREIIKKLSLKPYESEFKIMLIWHAEKINLQAGNTLLKILEEPPEKTIFILISDTTENFMPTILSRLQILKLNPIAPTAIEHYLIQQKMIPQEKATNIALFANGDLIEALQLIEEEAYQKEYFEFFTDFFRKCYKADVPGLINWSENISKLGREQQKRFVNYVLRLLRETVLYNSGSQEINRLLPYESEFIKKFAPFIHAQNILSFIHLFDEIFYYLERNGNPKLIFLDAALKTVKLIRVKTTA